ncbi:hypothetical protein Tco_0789377 [Tanacetum coccineum]
MKMASCTHSSGIELNMNGPVRISKDSPSYQLPTATVVNAPIVSSNTSVSTTIAQDAPSTSHSLSSLQVHLHSFPQGGASWTQLSRKTPQFLKADPVIPQIKAIGIFIAMCNQEYDHSTDGCQ